MFSGKSRRFVRYWSFAFSVLVGASVQAGKVPPLGYIGTDGNRYPTAAQACSQYVGTVNGSAPRAEFASSGLRCNYKDSDQFPSSTDSLHIDCPVGAGAVSLTECECGNDGDVVVNGACTQPATQTANDENPSYRPDSPKYKGIVGEEFVKDYGEQQGWILLGEQVHARIEGCNEDNGEPLTVIFDLIFLQQSSDGIHLKIYDAKNGDHARLTSNQRKCYPKANAGAKVTLYGTNAEHTGLADQPMRVKVEEFRVKIPTR